MSEITNKDIKKIARLARIEVDEAENQKLAQDLSKIIDWVETLDEVKTENVEPLVNVHDLSLRMEKDEISDGDLAEDVLKNSKKAKYGYFAVPKVIE